MTIAAALRIVRPALLCLGFLALGWPVPSADGHSLRARFTPQELEPLLQSLQDEGLPRPMLNGIFYDERLRKIRSVVALNGVEQDSVDIYKQYTTPYAVRKAKRFKRRFFKTLERVEEAYGIPANFIVAVLLVETQFGSYPLRYRVLEVYTTLVVEANHDAIERNFTRIKIRYPDLEREYFVERMTMKAEWAYEELVALLSMGPPNSGSLYDIKGSYAGAFGMPQFLPTSYLRWAVDGNEDGRVDLNTTADAVASIANYLREHGWRADAGLEEKMRAVWLYNHSPHYVNAIFEVSRRMSLPPRKSLVRRPARITPPVPAVAVFRGFPG